MVKDLELEVQGRRRRRDRDELSEGLVSVGGSRGEASRQSGSHWSRDRDSASPERHRPRNVVVDAMSRALRRAARSPFSDEKERAQMPSRFSKPPFISCDGKTDPVEHVSVEHVSHYIQMMSLYNQMTH